MFVFDLMQKEKKEKEAMKEEERGRREEMD